MNPGIIDANPTVRRLSASRTRGWPTLKPQRPQPSLGPLGLNQPVPSLALSEPLAGLHEKS